MFGLRRALPGGDMNHRLHTIEPGERDGRFLRLSQFTSRVVSCERLSTLIDLDLRIGAGFGALVTALYLVTIGIGQGVEGLEAPRDR